MARYALPVIGAAVGFYFGGPGGAALGWSIGAAIGGIVDPVELPDVVREGQRLDDLRVSSSAYGAFITITYGTVRTSGNIIWALPIIEDKTVTEEETGGKGGPEQSIVSTTYAYFARSHLHSVKVQVKVQYESGPILSQSTQYTMKPTVTQQVLALTAYQEQALLGSLSTQETNCKNLTH